MYDVLDLPDNVPQEKLYPLRAMLDQSAVLMHAIRQDEPWEALSRQYPALIEVAACLDQDGHPCTSVGNQLVDLYRRYCIEWDSFPAPQWNKVARRAA